MPDTTLRYLVMLRHIERRRRISAPELCEKLKAHGYEVSLRTVQRDLERLSTLFPLAADEAKPRGWHWTGEQLLDIPAMDPPTALSFVLAGRYLDPLLPPVSRQRLQPHIERARHVLDEASGGGVRRWPDKVRVLPRGLPLCPPQVDAAVLDTVYEALASERRVSVSYLPRGARRAKSYQLSLLGMVLRDTVVYLVTVMWEYDDIRQLVAHRIRSATLLEAPARRPPDFDLDRYIAEGGFGFPVGGAGKLALELLLDEDIAQHLAETPLSDDQVLTPRRDGRVRLTATVPDTAELRWWLLGFGTSVEVRRPAALRREFRDMSAELARRYRARS